MTKVIAFSNHKGGVGKTASTQNIGAGLAKKGYKVLLIDLDAQANLTVSFGVEVGNKSIYEALRGEIDMPIYNLKENLDLVPSNLDLSAIEIELLSQAGRDFFLRSLIAKVKSGYDYILIDCAPSIGVLTINALTAANYVIVPMEAHFLAVQGIQKLYDVIDVVKKRLNSDLVVMGILVTKYDKRKILERDIKESISNMPENRVFPTQIRNNVSIAEATYNGCDIFEYAPNSAGAEDYANLINEIVNFENKTHGQII